MLAMVRCKGLIHRAQIIFLKKKCHRFRKEWGKANPLLFFIEILHIDSNKSKLYKVSKQLDIVYLYYELFALDLSKKCPIQGQITQLRGR
jgi:hypothetical protein